jgi:hypothetical protein
MPTSADWIKSNLNSIAIAYVSPFIGIFDRLTGKRKEILKFDVDLSTSYVN